MSNNRLYIGNPRTGKRILISKGRGYGWDIWIKEEELNFFLNDPNNGVPKEAQVGEKTSLVIFSEYDDLDNSIKWESIWIDNLHNPHMYGMKNLIKKYFRIIFRKG